MILIVTNFMEVEKAITHIALVNDNDQIVGYEDKLKVHQEGLLHRTFSVVVINWKANVSFTEGLWISPIQVEHGPILGTEQFRVMIGKRFDVSRKKP